MSGHHGRGLGVTGRSGGDAADFMEWIVEGFDADRDCRTVDKDAKGAPGIRERPSWRFAWVADYFFLLDLVRTL